MSPRSAESSTPDSTRRLFVVYAVASLLPVVVLGAVMLRLLQRQASQVTLAMTLTVGLLALWLALLGVSSSVARRLRVQAAENSRLARQDTLTNLPNRARFTELATEVVTAATADRPVALALIDLDRFKEVNDALGHPTGDRLLVALAERLKNRMRPGDVVARLGGDEFGVILPGIRSSEECVGVLHELRTVLAEPLLLDGLPLALEASIGFALAPLDGHDTQSLMICADVAMYEAKRQHVGVLRHHARLNQYDAGTLSLVAQLAQAIRDDQLVLHYQPEADLRTGAITTVESLVRWDHPTRGLLFPDEFLPAAELTELVEPLTRWVLRRAMQDLRLMDPSKQLAVAVNISARSLTRADFVDDVLDVLTETRTDARRVILEVTETALLADPPRAAAMLSRLHDAGVRISIDDFGAGQTSLSHLAALPVSELKIDKQFVLAMRDDARNASIVRSIVELGHSLGLTVTAEGVDSTEVLAELARADCDLIQGHLLARPMAAGKVHRLLVNSRLAGRPWYAVPA